MRPAQKQNRARGRGNRKNGSGGGGNNLNRVYDSAGPEGKVRGTPQQIVDKYLSLARDAQTAGDRVTAENFLQHAEHYQRILLTAMGAQAERRETNGHAEDDEGEAQPPAMVEAAEEGEAPGADPSRAEEPAEGRRRSRSRRRTTDTAAAAEIEATDASSNGNGNGSGREIDGFGTIDHGGGANADDLLVSTDEMTRSQPRRRRNGAGRDGEGTTEEAEAEVPASHAPTMPEAEAAAEPSRPAEET
ncbi:MAG: DUF4167 domain-containing protein [Pseudomonadota bacterium]